MKVISKATLVGCFNVIDDTEIIRKVSLNGYGEDKRKIPWVISSRIIR